MIFISRASHMRFDWKLWKKLLRRPWVCLFLLSKHGFAMSSMNVHSRHTLYVSDPSGAIKQATCVLPWICVVTVMWGWCTVSGYTWMIFGLSLKSRVCWAPASCRSQLMGMWSRRFMSKWEKWTWEPAERRKRERCKSMGAEREIKIEHVQRYEERERERDSLPGPAMMAPPCWCRSPWKSNAGLVMALHILFICPIKIPDFTWGLGWAKNINIHTQMSSSSLITISEYTGFMLSFCYFITWVCKFLLSLHPKLLINAPLRVHVYFIRVPRQWAERLDKIKN